MDVRMIKLVTGEEIVAEVVDDDGYLCLTIKEPLLAVLSATGDPDRPLETKLFPWAQFVYGGVIHIDTEKIIYDESANEHMVDYYIKTIEGKNKGTLPE